MDLRFEAIFFDLGNTLMYDKEPWDPIFLRADTAMRQSLEQAGYPLDVDAYGDFNTIFTMYYHRRRHTVQEETTIQLLRELMDRQGATPPDAVLFAAMESMYAVTQENWYVEEDAAPTLKTLQEMGYQLGIISNAADDENVQGLIDKSNLRPYFEFIISSAACGIRKPDARIFQLALEHFKVPAGKTAMAGDLLEADILGANRLGIYSIWVTRRALTPPDGNLEIQPQGIVTTLGDIPKLIQELEQDLV